MAIQKLEAAPAPAQDASTPRVPREFTKQATVRDMLIRTGGATLQEIMAATGWQKHTVRGFISTLLKKTGIEDHQHPTRERPGAGLRSREVASQQGSRQERSWRLLPFR